MISTIALMKTADTGTFARYVPFDDQREVIVRRGRELGFPIRLRALAAQGEGEGRRVRAGEVPGDPFAAADAGGPAPDVR